MYRPTIRMADAYKDYFEEVASKSKLERTQVLRLAFFTAAHSEAFREIINEYKVADVDLPLPCWELWEDRFFLEVTPTVTEGKGGDVLQPVAKVLVKEEAAKAKAQVFKSEILTWALPAVRSAKKKAAPHF